MGRRPRADPACGGLGYDWGVHEEEVKLRLEALRKGRVRPERDGSLGEMFRERSAELQKLEKRLGGVARAWQSVCPPELLGRTSVRSLARGVLTIGVEDASTRFELDRVLRAGGERTFIRACPTTVRKLKLVSAQEAPEKPDDADA